MVPRPFTNPCCKKVPPLIKSTALVPGPGEVAER